MPQIRHLIVGVDPGKVSGVAVFDTITREFEPYEIPTWEAVGMVDTLLSHPRVEMEAVVVEDYVITRETLKKTRGENWSMESIGALRYLTQEHGIPLYEFTAHDSKAFGTDTKLISAGWWYPTRDGHQNDAARLLLKYLADTDRLSLVGLARRRRPQPRVTAEFSHGEVYTSGGTFTINTAPDSREPNWSSFYREDR